MIRISFIAISAMLLLSLVQCGVASAAEEPAQPPVAQGPALGGLDTNVNVLLDKVEEARQKVKTLKADVTFENKMEALEIEETWKGSFVFQAPRFVRMELKESVKGGKERYFIVGKDRAWMVHMDRKFVEIWHMNEAGKTDEMTLKRAPNPFEYGLTVGMRELLKTFNMRIVGDETVDGQEATILELMPKPPAPGEPEQMGFKKIVFWINKKSSLPVRVQQYKSRGEVIETYTLANLDVNPAVNPKLFEYEKPKNFEEHEYGTPEGLATPKQ
jgi:outer membrane lipoprotein-sorting protein